MPAGVLAAWLVQVPVVMCLTLVKAVSVIAALLQALSNSRALSCRSGFLHLLERFSSEWLQVVRLCCSPAGAQLCDGRSPVQVSLCQWAGRVGAGGACLGAGAAVRRSRGGRGQLEEQRERQWFAELFACRLKRKN